MGGYLRRAGRSNDRMLRRALQGRRRKGDALRTFVCSRCAQRHQEARGNGQRDGARRGDELRGVAKRVREVGSDEIRFTGQER
jgi:predicted metal-binding protein